MNDVRFLTGLGGAILAIGLVLSVLSLMENVPLEGVLPIFALGIFLLVAGIALEVRLTRASEPDINGPDFTLQETLSPRAEDVAAARELARKVLDRADVAAQAKTQLPDLRSTSE